MNDLVQALVLGIVEGLSEFLPISSTGHLLIAEHWLGARSELFNVAIQAGAIAASLAVFWPRLATLARAPLEAANRAYLMRLALAFALTVAGALAARKAGIALPDTVLPVALALVIGGVLMLAIEWRMPAASDATEATWKVAAWVGVAQVVAAVFPGTSRSAATIFAAMLAGQRSRPAATEFAFLVGIPTMFAATGYEFLKHRADAHAEDWSALALAAGTAALVAYASVRWLLRYVQSHRFTGFAWYRIAAGAALLLLAR